MSRKENIKDIASFLGRLNEFKSNSSVDLSSDEDLSIALMNLVSIEEHLYFSGMKTGKRSYFEMLSSVRELRKKLLAEIVKQPEGETWCISKHLLAASMRLIEVGNRLNAGNEREKAMEKFKDAFDLYSLFWGINLGLVKSAGLVENDLPTSIPVKSVALRDRLSAVVKKIIDCCKE